MPQVHLAPPASHHDYSSVSPAREMPEITLKAVILGILLAMIMGGANAYLGLKVGSTVSACIPAAVISMAVLRLFRTSNILENNIVQTTASAGEAVATGMVFTLPALVMLGYWQHFPFWMTLCVTTLGGLLGVLISVPLRRALIIENPLRFPEGVATAEVLQAGERHVDQANDNLKNLVWGGFWAALIKFAQTGIQICSESFSVWTSIGGTIFGFGGGYSLAIIGSGYIVGLASCVSILTGGIIAWVFGVPLYGLIVGLPEAPTAAKAASLIWGSHIRMMGVGAMVVGGVWTVFMLIEPIKNAIWSSFNAFWRSTQNRALVIMPRAERDIPFPYVLGGVLGLGVLMMGMTYFIFDSHALDVPIGSLALATIAVSVLLLLIGFLCASISGYMTGILGSTHTPYSGVTLISILIFSGVLLFLFNDSLQFALHAERALQASGTVILIGCVVACASAVSGDNLQDLKSGKLVGSTPWKQQVMLMVGVVAGCVALAPVTELLFQAYGIGDIMPREGMDPSHALSAPKAAMMANLSAAIFTGSMNWTLFLIGAVIATSAIFVDQRLKVSKASWRLPVLGVALGIYMPLEVTFPFVIGGLIAFLADRTLRRRAPRNEKLVETNRQRGTLICAGFIAGESLIGVLLAVPFAIYKSTEVFRWIPEPLAGWTGLLGVVVSGWAVYALYQKTSASKS